MIGILLPIKPKWCALMMNGSKTVEVRKENVGKAVQKLIDKYGFADIYAYCTKEEELYKFSWAKTWYENFKHFTDMGCDQAHALDSDNLNGKVLFKFRCYKVEPIIFGTTLLMDLGFFTGDLHDFDLYKKSCLTKEEMQNYLKVKPNGSSGSAIHISELEIFDKPKELYEFESTKQCLVDVMRQTQPILQNITLTKAPQSFCYIEVS